MPSVAVCSQMRRICCAPALVQERFTVAPGVPPVAAGSPTAGRRMAGADRYILALGTVEPRKDYAALVRAFDHLAAERDDVNLVVAGADGWAVDTFGEEVRRARHGDRVVRLGFLDEADNVAHS